LTNHTSGGDGAGTRIKSEAERENLRQQRLGKTFDELYGERAVEIKAKIRASRADKPMLIAGWNAGLTKHNSPGVKKISEANAGKTPWNKGLKNAQVGSFNGKEHSDDAKAKISAANKGKTPWNKGKAGPTGGRKRVYNPDGTWKLV
jgi:hypothetical protein